MPGPDARPPLSRESARNGADRGRILPLRLLLVLVVVGLGIGLALGGFGGLGDGAESDGPGATQTTPTPTQQPYQGDKTVVRRPFEPIAIDYTESLDFKNFDVTHANYSGNTAYFWITDDTPRTTDANSTDEWAHGFAMGFKQSWANETHTGGVDQIVVKYQRNTFYRLDEWQVHRIIVGDGHDIGVPMQTTAIIGRKDPEVELDIFLQKVNAIDGITIREAENYGPKIVLTVEAESTDREYLTDRLMRMENLSSKHRTTTFGPGIEMKIADRNGDAVWYQKSGPLVQG